MTTLTFAVTWDYRCPFAANAHDLIVEGLLNGADWHVTFIPFSLSQTRIDEGLASVWDDPSHDSGLPALLAGVAVRDLYPNSFLKIHRALFRARHVDSRKIRDKAVVDAVLAENNIDVETVADAIASGSILQTIRQEHEAAVSEHNVWGVPTFIARDQAVFVRLMRDAKGDPAYARRTIERLIDDIVDWTDLNEFKHTSQPR